MAVRQASKFSTTLKRVCQPISPVLDVNLPTTYRNHINSRLEDVFPAHARAWKTGVKDRGHLPLFAQLSGSSDDVILIKRNFPTLVQQCAEKNELGLPECVDFDVTLSPTDYAGEHVVGASLGRRMRSLLLEDEEEATNCDPLNVIEEVARLKGVNVADLFVLLRIDGLEALPHVSGSQDSVFMHEFVNYNRMINESSALLVVFCAGVQPG